jgi:hypothetical protein
MEYNTLKRLLTLTLVNQKIRDKRDFSDRAISEKVSQNFITKTLSENTTWEK